MNATARTPRRLWQVIEVSYTDIVYENRNTETAYGLSMPAAAMRRDLAIQFIQRILHSFEHRAAAQRQMVHARSTPSAARRRAQPPTPGHSTENRIQRPWAQSVTVVVKLLKHPLAVDAALSRVMQDVNLPERQQEFAN